MMTDPDDQKTAFDLITVILADEEVQARPTEFAYSEITQMPEEALTYETTCPRCSQLVNFRTHEIIKSNSKLYIKGCDDCPVANIPLNNDIIEEHNEVEVEEKEKIEGADFDSIINDDAFIDPIANDKMKLDGAIKLN